MITLPKKNDIVKTVTVKAQIPQGVYDRVSEKLAAHNQALDDSADVEFLIVNLLEAYAGAPDKATKPAPRAKGDTPRIVESQAA